MILLPALVAAMFFGATAAAADKAEPVEIKVSDPYVSSMTDRRVGGAVAPAALPAGAMSVYALLGAPDLGGGFRQGLAMMELEVKLNFNYLLAAGVLEVGVRVPVYEKGKIQMAPTVAIGIEANSGSRYYDRANFAYVAVRPRVGFITSLRITDTLAAIVLFDLPWAVAVTAPGSHVVPTVGGGAEMHLGGNISGFIIGNVGVDAIKEPLGVTQYRPAWAVRLGLGFRLF